MRIRFEPRKTEIHEKAGEASSTRFARLRRCSQIEIPNIGRRSGVPTAFDPDEIFLRLVEPDSSFRLRSSRGKFSNLWKCLIHLSEGCFGMIVTSVLTIVSTDVTCFYGFLGWVFLFGCGVALAEYKRIHLVSLGILVKTSVTRWLCFVHWNGSFLLSKRWYSRIECHVCTHDREYRRDIPVKRREGNCLFAPRCRSGLNREAHEKVGRGRHSSTAID